MEIHYIKVCGASYYPTPKEIQREGYVEGVFIPYCIITKMSYGRYKIQYEDYYNNEFTLIAYPSGIEEIQFKKK